MRRTDDMYVGKPTDGWRLYGYVKGIALFYSIGGSLMPELIRRGTCYKLSAEDALPHSLTSHSGLSPLGGLDSPSNVSDKPI